MGKRLPTILGKAIDDTIRTLNEQSDEDMMIDLNKCIDRMHTLMHDLQHNAKLRWVGSERSRRRRTRFISASRLIPSPNLVARSSTMVKATFLSGTVKLPRYVVGLCYRASCSCRSPQLSFPHLAVLPGIHFSEQPMALCRGLVSGCLIRHKSLGITCDCR